MDANRVRKFHRGVTLLELILALGLSVAVLMAIGMAIDLNYRMLDVRRTNVEEAQLASSVLRHMADDLRCSIQYSPPDTNSLTAVAQNAVSAAAVSITNAAGGVTGAGSGPGGGTGGGTGQGNGTGGGSQNTQTTGGQGQGNQNTGSQSNPGNGGGAGGQNSGSTGAGSGGPAALNMGAATPIDPNATAANPTSVVGLYGSATQLQFDISRLPRIDQYQALMDGSGLGAVDIPSDVKTVIYFLQADGATLPGDETANLAVATVPEPSTTGQGRGLMRSEIDRAVASWAEANGATQSLYADAKLLAAEVTGLEFRYFDGAEWLSDWDSTAMDGLPVAVEILMAIPSSNPASEAETSGDLSADAASLLSGETYRMVVHLPVAVSAQQKLAEADAAQAAVASAQAATVSGNGQFANNTTGAGGAGQIGGGGQGNNGQGGQGQGGNGPGGPGGNNAQGGPGGQGPGQGQPGVPGFGNGGSGGFPGIPGGPGGQGFPGMPNGNSGNGRGNGGPPGGNFGPRPGGQGQGSGTQGQGFQRPGSFGNARGGFGNNRGSGGTGGSNSGAGGTSRGR